MPTLHTITCRFFWDESLNIWVPNSDPSPSQGEIDICAFIKPNREGFSDWFDIDALHEMFPELSARIGGNGSNMFTRQLGRDFNFDPDQSKMKDGSRIIKRRAYGLVKTRDEQYPIRKDIKNALSNKPCAVLNTRSQIEVDHKDGRKDSWLVNDIDLQSIDDFQPLHKTANIVKREVCKSCSKTNQRFDARVLGFSFGWTEGASQYQGSCKGCFWYDPVAFRSALRIKGQDD